MMQAAAFLSLLPGALPESLWYAKPAIWAALGLTAAVDARTGRVPDLPLLLAGGIALVASQLVEGWSGVALRLLMASSILALLWLCNEFYYKHWGRDAFGMGDAKWTALAIFGFGLTPVIWAWVFAAWLGIIWLGGRALVRLVIKKRTQGVYVHFAPFLFVGLLFALYGKKFIF